ncbi:MAG: hypothetical protein R2815_11375 [Flavobacteriales bacterium]
MEQAAKETGYDFSGLHLPKSDKEVYSLSYETLLCPCESRAGTGGHGG